MSPQLKGDVYPERWDPRWIERRIQLEIKRLGYTGHGHPPGRTQLPLPYRLLKWGIQASGLYKRGYRNFTDIQLNTISHYIPNWPEALAGFKILQISDLHIDLDPGLMAPLCQILKDSNCELAVFTGDFWEGTNPQFDTALENMETLLEALPEPPHGCYGVLGNHDAAALGAALEDRGINILVNEAAVIEAGTEAFALAGVDDPYFFGMHDLEKAVGQCPAPLHKVLLSHSPQVAEAASAAGFHLMLSGHTHGGQICLPGGHSLVQMDEIPSPLFKGAWQRGSLSGYTTTGTGACHLPLRFNCPAEIVLHSIYRAPR